MSKSKIFLYFLCAFLTGVLVASVLVLPGQPLDESGNVLKFIAGFSTIAGVMFLILSWPRPFHFRDTDFSKNIYENNFKNDIESNKKGRGWRKNKKFLIGFLILFFAFGIFWYQRDVDASAVERGIIANEIIGDGKAQGVIIDEPEFKNDRAKYVATICPEDKYHLLNDRSIGDILQCQEKDIKILIQVPRYPEYRYGDEVLIEGKIEEPENFTKDFDWRSYLAKDGIYLVVYDPRVEILAKNKGSKTYAALYQFKNRIENIFRDNLSEPHASLLSGITLGSKSGISEDIYEKFKETGVAHIVALSGYNISIIASVLMGLMMFFMVSRNISFGVSVVVIIFFVLMTGASASVVRAAVMGVLVLVARQQGRMYAAANALIFAGAVMVMLNPKILRFDVGFQLSFLATLGLIILYPKLEEKLKNAPKLLGTKESFIATISAQVFVLPLLIYQFGYFSLTGILVNVLILPAVPIAMFLGFLGAFASFIFAPFAKLFLWPAWLFLEWILAVVGLF